MLNGSNVFIYVFCEKIAKVLFAFCKMKSAKKTVLKRMPISLKNDNPDNPTHTSPPTNTHIY